MRLLLLVTSLSLMLGCSGDASNTENEVREDLSDAFTKTNLKKRILEEELVNQQKCEELMGELRHKVMNYMDENDLPAPSSLSVLGEDVKTTDPWGEQITVTGQKQEKHIRTFLLVSGGPDKTIGTNDDIQVESILEDASEDEN